MSKKILIVGGGPSGLAAGLFAKAHGADVVILEQFHKPGGKLYVSGNGCCNFTNMNETTDAYRGSGTGFAEPAIAALPPSELRRWLGSLGVPSIERNGWVYPRTMESRTVVNALLLACEEAGVRIKTKERVLGAGKDGDVFRIRTATWEYEADALILASGSDASNARCATKDGYGLARSFGLALVETMPALTHLRTDDPIANAWDRVRVNGTAELRGEDVSYGIREGQIQLIQGGISGIPIFQLSRYANEILSRGKRAELLLDLCPDTGSDELLRQLTEWKERYPHRSLKQLLCGLLPERLAASVANRCPEAEEAVCCIKELRLGITGSGSLKEAQVCAGGVSSDELDPATLMAVKIPGLFFAGELCDIDGDCGGYNLQWAFSSGALAGRSAALL